MKLSFLQFEFNIEFIEPAIVDTNPLFVLRGMLGKNLRSMCCISRKSACGECLYSKTCVYSYIFETILPSDNSVLPGRNKGCHPYSLSVKNRERKNPMTEYSFVLTLFGKSVEYLPYIYAAFVRVGNDGIFKRRSHFRIKSVVVRSKNNGGKNILIDENHLDMEVEMQSWKSSDESKLSQHEILVELNSPLRFKFGGKYGTDFSAQDFMSCLYRRAKTLCSLYGKLSEEDFQRYIPSESLEITDRKIKWIDFNHYSARQKNSMELGGSVGNFKITGNFSGFELSLLELNKIAGAGKNTNFGLGQIDYWMKGH